MASTFDVLRASTSHCNAPSTDDGRHAPSTDGLAVDVCVASADDGDGYDLPLDGEMRPGLQLSALAAILAKPSSGPRLSEIICWNCKGLGHPKSKCPSAKKERTYAAVIRELTGAMSRNDGAAPATPLALARRGPPRRSGGARRAGSSNVSAYLMTDGTFVLSTGEQADWAPAEDAPLSLPEEFAQDDAPAAAEDYEACNAIRIIERGDPDWPASNPAGDPPAGDLPAGDPPADPPTPPVPAMRLRGAGKRDDGPIGTSHVGAPTTVDLAAVAYSRALRKGSGFDEHGSMSRHGSFKRGAQEKVRAFFQDVLRELRAETPPPLPDAPTSREVEDDAAPPHAEGSGDDMEAQW